MTPESQQCRVCAPPYSLLEPDAAREANLRRAARALIAVDVYLLGSIASKILKATLECADLTAAVQPAKQLAPFAEAAQSKCRWIQWSILPINQTDILFVPPSCSQNNFNQICV
jgi:hypothetical protein